MREPPYDPDSIGGSSSQLCQNNVKYSTVSDGVYVSDSNLSLLEFYRICKSYLNQHQHAHKHLTSAQLVHAAEIVLNEGVCLLSALFKQVYPGIVYKADTAMSRLLRLPLACIRIGETSDGTSHLIVMESVKGADYEKIREIYSRCLKSMGSPRLMSKDEVKQLLTLNREKEMLRYAIFKSSGVTQSMARKHFGFERMNERSAEVEMCIDQIKHIHESCEEMVAIRLKALQVSGDMPTVSDESDKEEAEEKGCGGGVHLTPQELNFLALLLKEW